MTDQQPTVIVGAGTAGLAAAVTAGEIGQRVILLEKTDRIGGMLHWSSGHFSAAATRRQKEKGITDTIDQHYNDVMEIGHNLNNASLVSLAVTSLPAMVDWLDDLGFSFDPTTPTLVQGHEVYSQPRTYWGGDDSSAGGTEIARVLAAHLDESYVDVQLNTRVVGVKVAGSPGGLSVCGIEVEQSGRIRTIASDRILLATGGYAANRSLVAELQPDASNALVGCMPHATGDAHRILQNLGVEIVGGETYLPTMGMIEDPDQPGVGLRLNHARLIVDTSQRRPWEIWVNADGERFVNEDASSPYEREIALLAQDGIAMHVIWDRGVLKGTTPPIGPDWTWSMVERESDRGRWLHRAETLQELGAKLGIDGQALETTAAAFAGQRADPFGREHRPLPIQRPPFYGVTVTGGMLLSRGGPRVDDQLRPLDATGSPIRGLHAVGEILGMTQFSGDSFAGGMSVGPALALGRLVMQRYSKGASG